LDQYIVERNVVASDQPINEQNGALSNLKPEEKKIVSSEIRIENRCIKQSMWIRFNKDYNLYYKLNILIEK
jgi:hypothetical protein